MPDKEEETLGRLPDGGYGWVMGLVGALMAIAFTQNLGVTGVLMVELMEHFQCNKASVSWLGAIVLFMFVTAVGNTMLFKRYGIRKVGLVWSPIGTVGLILSSQATELWMLYITYGVITGTSLICYNLAAVLIIPMWFEKRLTLAMSMVFTGSALGVLIWPPLTSFLIEEYGWRGAMLLMSGAHLNCLVLFALVRPPPTPRKPIAAPAVANGNEHEYSIMHHSDNIDDDAIPSSLHSSLDLEKHPSVSSEENARLDSNNSHLGSTEKEFPIKMPNDSLASLAISMNPDTASHGTKQSTYFCLCCAHNQQQDATTSKCNELWKRPIFYVFMLATTFAHIGYFAPYSFLPIRAEMQMYSKTKGAYLVTIVGVTTGVIRPLCGYLGDKFPKRRVLMYIVYHTGAGLASILSCASENYAFLCVYAAVFSIFTGGAGVVVIIVVIDMFGRQNVDILVSVLAVCLAFSGLIGNLIAGAVIDTSGFASFAFVTAGVLQILGVCLYLIVCVVLSHQKKAHNSTNTS